MANEHMEEWGISPEDVKNVTEVLKEGRIFLTSLPSGEIPGDNPGDNPGELGLYYQDTRFLSGHEITLSGTKPLLLSGGTRDSHFAQIELANRELITGGGRVLPLHTLHLRVSRVLRDAFHQRLRLLNFNSATVEVELGIMLGADFMDVFEVRGLPRPCCGQIRTPEIFDRGVRFAYLGLDGKERFTEARFSRPPDRVEVRDKQVYLGFSFRLHTRVKNYLFMQVTPEVAACGTGPARLQNEIGKTFYSVARELEDDYRSWAESCTRIDSDNEIFNEMICAGVTDLRSLTTHYPGWGRIVEAGIPWYGAPFGRDALITSWQTLTLNPDIARSTLKFLAALQGKEINAWREERPGKIPHEIRFGEMACAGEVPHTPYFGSVDATPWFIIVLSEYYRWTGDREFLTEMAPALDAALLWCTSYSDLDGDGLIEYHRESERGLAHQGWKDSWDGVVDREGRLPEGPIALVEVQAYYYLALRRAAALIRALGNKAGARAVEEQAAAFQQRFLERFWVPEENYAAFALDGKKELVLCTVSNPGHCLFTGVLSNEQAGQVARRLFAGDMYSGWGIRTMSSRELPYNPMSYHRGSVWPHDNVIIARGLRRYGMLDELLQLADGLYRAATFFPYRRLPELFCGFTRRGAVGPVRFPTACDPQAWAVGAVFLLLQALLGIECRGRSLQVRRPVLPDWINEIMLSNLRIGDGDVDLEFARRRGRTYCSVTRRRGDVRVVMEP